jgi:EAL domain-containing protein (putative c-di-GMP-specific phosphodiesterase class I)
MKHAIRLAGLEPGRIVVEITEDVLLDEVSPHAITDLVALREGGIRLALDDFGTGTSGLAQLLRLPLDILKLDRTFTRHLGEDGRSEQVIRSALRLARSLRLGVVIEGVETAGQARTLGLMGCEMAQGWHFARALTAADLADWMAGREKIVMLPAPRRRLAPAQ